MKFKLVTVVLMICAFSCDQKRDDKVPSGKEIKIEGTWQLISGTIIEKGDTTVTDYTGNTRMIKILNATHFSFLNHDLKKGEDSTAVFAAGGGQYTLDCNQYTEYLDYCSFREWEGNSFKFTVTLQGDTLT